MKTSKWVGAHFFNGMVSKQISIYATQGDLLTVLREVCSGRPLEFVVAGLFDQAQVLIVREPSELMPCTNYLAFDKGTKALVRSVPQRKGGIKYAVDQVHNPQSVTISCGGILNDNRLIAGQIGTAASGKSTQEIYRLFAKAVQLKFERIKSYYVGPEAVQLLDSGFRLTPTAKSPEQYDLARWKDRTRDTQTRRDT